MYTYQHINVNMLVNICLTCNGSQVSLGSIDMVINIDLNKCVNMHINMDLNKLVNLNLSILVSIA